MTRRTDNSLPGDTTAGLSSPSIATRSFKLGYTERICTPHDCNLSNDNCQFSRLDQWHSTLDDREMSPGIADWLRPASRWVFLMKT